MKRRTFLQALAGCLGLGAAAPALALGRSEAPITRPSTNVRAYPPESIQSVWTTNDMDHRLDALPYYTVCYDVRWQRS